MKLKVVALLAIALAACGGAEGPAGAQGPAGQDGAPGRDFTPLQPTALQIAYNTVPDPLPYSVPSHSFEAQGTSEFGEKITLSSNTGRHLARVAVVMVNYGQTPAGWGGPNGVATPSYSWPITLKLYAPDLTPIASVTKVVDVPARPESNQAACGGPYWLAPNGTCYGGFAFEVSFDLDATLPDSLVYSIAYNTQGNGPKQTGQWGYYNNLNVGMVPGTPETLYSTITPAYDTGAGTFTTPTPGTFSVATRVSGNPTHPAVKFEIAP